MSFNFCLMSNHRFLLLGHLAFTWFSTPIDSFWVVCHDPKVLFLCLHAFVNAISISWTTFYLLLMMKLPQIEIAFFLISSYIYWTPLRFSTWLFLPIRFKHSAGAIAYHFVSSMLISIRHLMVEWMSKYTAWLICKRQKYHNTLPFNA